MKHFKHVEKVKFRRKFDKYFWFYLTGLCANGHKHMVTGSQLKNVVCHRQYNVTGSKHKHILRHRQYDVTCTKHSIYDIIINVIIILWYCFIVYHIKYIVGGGWHSESAF